MAGKTSIVLLAVVTLAFAAPVSAQQANTSGKDKLVVDMQLAGIGAKLFKEKACNACHTVGHGKMVGPDLAGVFERRTLEWLTRWLKNPSAMLESDRTAKALLKEYNGIPMPDLGLTDEQVEALLHYLASAEKPKK